MKKLIFLFAGLVTLALTACKKKYCWQVWDGLGNEMAEIQAAYGNFYVVCHFMEHSNFKRK